ncbi:Fungal-trans domain-containing protein [Mycena sanguinolenta]|uniref:Fungal-trans domain-containing protein n=1 Tax=Mycena sanguinolenta TaxID=230812 RepID=A0A8H6X790_9AGAR|nr:Fungal-trans domain-containing protein [Mycena sanguinolenta]
MPNGRCTHCLSFNLSCTYIKPTKKRGPKNVTLEGLKNEIKSLKSKLQSSTLCSACSQPLEPSPQAEDPLWSNFPGGTAERDDPSPTSSPESSAEDLGRHFTQLSLKHYGSASGFRLLTATIAMKAKQLGTSQTTTYSRRPFFWDTLSWEKEAYDRRTRYVYPAEDLISSLLELYFTNFHPTLPILHRPSFEQAVAAGVHLTDHEFGGTVLAVLAVASRYSDDPRVYVDRNAPHSAGWTFANQVQHLRPLSNPTIHETQIYFLLSIYAFGTSVPRMSWLYLGLGIRCLHERREFRRKSNGDKVDPVHELWKRAFWSYLIWDRMMSVFHGWPVGLQAEDYDVDPLLEVDDEYWDKGIHQPPGKPSQLAYSIYVVRLCEILGDAMRQLYGSEKARSKNLVGSEDPEWEKRAVAELDSAMNNFLDSVPSHLRWNHESPPHAAFFDQAAILHITYNHVLIVIHRPYIQKATVLAAPSLSICARAARAIIHTAGIWLNKRQRLPLPSVINPVFISGVILVLYTVATTNRGSRPAGDKNKDLVHVATAMEILKYAEHRVQTAGRLWDLLQQLWSLGGPVPLSPAPQEEAQSDIGVVLSTSAGDGGVSAALPPHPDEYYTLAIPEYVPPQEESYNFFGLEGVFSLGNEATAVGPRAGMSVEELLADADPLDTMASILNDEQRSMWMAAPMDTANFHHWDTYFENKSTNTNSADANIPLW